MMMNPQLEISICSLNRKVVSLLKLMRLLPKKMGRRQMGTQLKEEETPLDRLAAKNQFKTTTRT